MTNAIAETVSEVHVLQISSEEFERLVDAMAFVNSSNRQVEQAYLDNVVTLFACSPEQGCEEQQVQGPFALPAAS